MNPRVIAGGVLASLWLLGLPTWTVEYRLPVVNLDALTVLAHLDNSGPAPHVDCGGGLNNYPCRGKGEQR